jgi:hypothetical protein
MDVPSKDYFPDQASKLMRKLLAFGPFGTRVLAERLGIRQKFVTPFNGTFDDLVGRFAGKFFWISEAAKNALGSDATLVDVGAPLNFRDQYGSFNTATGPMRREEMSRFFTKDEPFPEIGLYFDIDYFKKPDAPLDVREVERSISTFARLGWERHERVRQLIFG